MFFVLTVSILLGGGRVRGFELWPFLWKMILGRRLRWKWRSKMYAKNAVQFSLTLKDLTNVYIPKSILKNITK